MTNQEQIERSGSPELATPGPHRRFFKRRVVGLVVGLLLAGWLLPILVRLNYLQDEIAAALSISLGRPVRVGDVHPHLVGGLDSGVSLGLGFEVENVEIADDPRFGIEPVARIEVVEARLAVRSIWRRRFEFSRITLVRPSINLVRAATENGGIWNFSTLAGAHATASGVGEGNAADPGIPDYSSNYPDIRIVDGRWNIKLDNRKKTLYLGALDLDLRAPRKPNEPWVVEFSATPSRSTFAQMPAFLVRGEGQIGPFAGAGLTAAGVPMKLSWRVEDALLGEVAGVLAGSEQGVHGSLNVSGEVAGTTSLLRVMGRAVMSDLHSWDKIPRHTPTEIPAEFSGILDLQQDAFQVVNLSFPISGPISGGPLKGGARKAGRIRVEGRIEQLSTIPLLRLDAQLNDLSLTALSALAEQFSLGLDPSLQIKGMLGGSIEMHGLPETWSGELLIEHAEFQRLIADSVAMPSAPGTEKDAASPVARVRMGSVPIRFGKGKFEAGPATADFGAGGPLRIVARGNLFDPVRSIALRGNQIALTELLHWAPLFRSELRGEPSAAWLSMTAGSAALNLEINYAADSSVKLTGRADIDGAQMRVSRLEVPLELTSARVQFRNRTMQMRSLAGKIGDTALRGVATLSLPAPVSLSEPVPLPPIAITFNLETDELHLDSAAKPLPASERSWLSALFNRNKPVSHRAFPPLAAVGKLKAARILYAGLEFTNATGSAKWDGGALTLSQVRAGLADGEVQGEGVFRLSDAPFAIDLSTKFQRVNAEALADRFPEWRGQFAGHLNGELLLKGSGDNWEQVQRELQGAGELSGKEITVRRWPLQRGPSAVSPSAVSVVATAPAPVPDAKALPAAAEFAEFKASFQIAKQSVQINEFAATAASRDAVRRVADVYRATGTIGFDHAVNLTVESLSEGRKEGLAQQWVGALSDLRLVEAIPVNRNASLQTR
ncbi:MAG: AsmA family protein [Acidobacteria bacterium]|nr:AsmA family protein [Acidobacteriota bacterium]